MNNGKIAGQQILCYYNKTSGLIDQLEEDLKNEWKGTIEIFQNFLHIWKNLLNDLGNFLQSGINMDLSLCERNVTVSKRIG